MELNGPLFFVKVTALDINSFQQTYIFLFGEKDAVNKIQYGSRKSKCKKDSPSRMAACPFLVGRYDSNIPNGPPYPKIIITGVVADLSKIISTVPLFVKLYYDPL